MLRKKKKQIPPHKKYRLRILPRHSKYIDYALAALSLVVVVLLGSTAIRMVQGESKSLPQEITILRTQVANGCGVQDVAGRFAEWLEDQSDDFLKFDIIDVSNYDNSAIPTTMVLIRDQLALPKARQIAARLGIPEENISFSELEDNFLAFDITVVVGQDYEKYRSGPTILRTDILNGCGVKGVARKFAIQLDEFADERVEFEVNKEENFDNFDVRESLLIIKSGKAGEYSEHLAEKFDIKKDNIITETGAQSFEQNDITIVLGRDWGQRLTTN